VPPVQGDAPAGSIPTPKDYPQIWLRPFVGGVIAAGTVATLLGFALSPRSDWVAIGLLTVLAVIAELFQLDLYGDSSVSVSVAIAFAAALLAGLPGVASVSAAIALAHYFRRRPPLYRTAFNWATHVLAGAVPALTTSALALPLHMPTLFLLAVPAAAGLAYYAIETGLIAIAISLSQGASPLHKWRYQYQWLVYHYLVLCTLGLFLTVAYTALGPRGILVFVLPVLMMRHAQKQYIERTSHSMQELTRMNLELTRANHEVVAASQAIGQLNDELFLTLAKIIDARDPYVSGHAAQVATYATTIALELELPADRVEQVRQAAFLHDIGKIGVPEKILHKPARLTDEEYEQVKTHVTLGAGFLETSQGLRHLAPFVRHHHERWDGRGYPDGLCEEQIPMEARILAVCDAVEAMASDRPYHAAMSPADIVAEVRRCAGTQFDPTVAEAFARIVEHKGDQFIVNSAHAVAQKAADDGNLMHQQNGWFRPLESPQTSPIWTPEHAKIT
jgi:putative nucleotidyltransferase with HDIG domain